MICIYLSMNKYYLLMQQSMMINIYQVFFKTNLIMTMTSLNLNFVLIPIMQESINNIYLSINDYWRLVFFKTNSIMTMTKFKLFVDTNIDQYLHTSASMIIGGWFSSEPSPSSPSSSILVLTTIWGGSKC